MRNKKMFYSAMCALLQEIVTVGCGFILPKIILMNFGSSVNGLITSISQFVGFVTLLRAGVGGVTRAALYEPLAKKDNERISAIVNATEIFMRKIALIFIVFLLLFAILYPFLVMTEFTWPYTFTLVVILGFGTFVQYYFGITYSMLIEADQRQYINSLLSIFTTILNTMLALAVVSCGGGIHIVKLAGAVAFSVNPIALHFYIRKKYKISQSVSPDNAAISQRMDAGMHQIAAFIRSNTDVIVLTVFSSLSTVSVYAVHNLVVSGIQRVAEAFAGGIESTFGDMLAKKECHTLDETLEIFEFVYLSAITVLYTCTALLLSSFVDIFTSGISDINYHEPLFAWTFAMSGLLYCYRIPYQSLANAAGHYKQTKNSAIIEAIINVTLSIILVSVYGLIGVAIGTLSAMLYRSVYYAIYVSNKIMNSRSIWLFTKRSLISVVNITATIIIMNNLPMLATNSYSNWIKYAFIVFLSCVATTTFSTFLFDRIIFKRIYMKIEQIIFIKKL